MSRAQDLGIIEDVAHLINLGLSNDEIADEKSSCSKADLIGAIRLYAEEFIHEDNVNELLTRLEDLGDKVPGRRLETLLDKRMTPEAEEGDYLVTQKEIHEQVCLVRSEDADSKEKAAAFVRETGGSAFYGTTHYDRMPSDFDYAVFQVGEPREESRTEYFNVDEV